MPPGYVTLLEDIKNRVRRAQVRAAVTGNRELLCLYWEIGHEIVTRQRRDGWGARIIDCLAADLQKVFPGIKGFSRTNIQRMRAFYSAYAAENEIVPQAVGQLESAVIPSAVADIPWGHNVVLLEKLTVEYSLRDTRKPIGVSKYRLTATLPSTLQSSLPTVEQLEEELKCPETQTEGLYNDL